MNCRVCKVKMQPERGTHHKKKRFRCPECGRRRMESVLAKQKNANRRARKISPHNRDD